MSLVRLNIKSRIELETRVLAAALKQSFESGDTDGAGLAHRQLFALLKDVGRPPGEVGSILVADGMPKDYSEISSSEEQMLIDAARATTKANSQNADEKSQERQFGEQMTDWVAQHGHSEEADARQAGAAHLLEPADPHSTQEAGFDSPSRNQENSGSLAAKLYSQPLFSPYAGNEQGDKEEDSKATTPEPVFRAGFMRNSTRLQPTVRTSGAKHAAIQPDAGAPKSDEEAKEAEGEPQARAHEDDVEMQKRTSENLPESDRRVDNGGVAGSEDNTEQVDHTATAPYAVPDHVSEQDAYIAGVPGGDWEKSLPSRADSEHSSPGEDAPAFDASAGAQTFSRETADSERNSLENTGTIEHDNDAVEAETIDVALPAVTEPTVEKSRSVFSRTAGGGDAKAATVPETTRATDFDAPMYQLLNVSQMAAFEEIHIKFLRRAKRVLAEIKANKAIRYEKLPELQKFWVAHDILTDPVTRTDYDFRYLGVRGTQEVVEHPPEEQQTTRLSSRTPLRIGELLQAAHLLEPAELEIACDMHKAMPEVQFGTFLVRQGFIEEHHLEAALIGQKLLRAGAISVAQFQMAMDISNTQRKPIGDVLIQAAWITDAQLEHALNPPPPEEPPPLTVQIREVPLAKKVDAKTAAKPAWNDQLDWGPPEVPKTESGTGSDQKKSLGGFLASQQLSKPQISNKSAVPSWQDQIDWDQESAPAKESEAEAAAAENAEAQEQAAKASQPSEVAGVVPESSDPIAPPVPPGVGFYAQAPDASAPPSPGIRFSNAVPTWKDQLDWGSPDDAAERFAAEADERKSGDLDLPKPTEIEIAPLSLEELQANAAPVVGFGPSGSGAARTSPDDTATGLSPAVYTQPESVEPQPGAPANDAPAFGVPDSRALTVELSAAAAKQLREMAFGSISSNTANQTPAGQSPAGDAPGRSTTGELGPALAPSQDAGGAPAAASNPAESDRASTGELGDALLNASKQAMATDSSAALKPFSSSQAETAAIPIQDIPKLPPRAPSTVPTNSDSRVPANESILSYGKMARAFGAEEDYSSTPKPAEGDASAPKPNQDAPQQGGFFAHLVKSAISAFRTTGNFPAQPPPQNDAAETTAPHDENQTSAPNTEVAAPEESENIAPDMVLEDAGDEAAHDEQHDEHSGEDQATSVTDDDQKKPKKIKDKRRKRK